MRPILIVIGVLLAIMIIFTFVDWYFQREKRSKNKSKKSATVAVAGPSTTTPKAKKEEEKTTPSAPVVPHKIYNSELADDLNEMLKNSQAPAESRLRTGQHINAKSHIAQYIEQKKYKTFGADENQEESFSMEDYKRIIALSNIDDRQ